MISVRIWIVRLARLCGWATAEGIEVGQVDSEVGGGVNGNRPGLARVLSDLSATVIVVEHRDRAGPLRSGVSEGCVVRPRPGGRRGR